MFFGFEDSLKDLKKELKAAGADMSFVKDWQKSYDKVRKQCVQIEAQYVQAKQELEVVYDLLRKMEQFLISCKENISSAEVTKNVSGFGKELKKYQGHFAHEFFVSKEDSNFQLTYGTIVNLCEKGFKEKKDVLILQSEVENLLAIAKEALEKALPSFRAVAYFYIEHTDKELFDLPQQEKINFVEKIYETEFVKPMQQVVAASLGEQRANKVMEVDLWIC